MILLVGWFVHSLAAFSCVDASEESGALSNFYRWEETESSIETVELRRGKVCRSLCRKRQCVRGNQKTRTHSRGFVLVVRVTRHVESSIINR